MEGGVQLVLIGRPETGGGLIQSGQRWKYRCQAIRIFLDTMKGHWEERWREELGWFLCQFWSVTGCATFPSNIFTRGKLTGMSPKDDVETTKGHIGTHVTSHSCSAAQCSLGLALACKPIRSKAMTKETKKLEMMVRTSTQLRGGHQI